MKRKFRCEHCEELFPGIDIWTYWTKIKEVVPDNNPYPEKLCLKCGLKASKKMHKGKGGTTKVRLKRRKKNGK